MMDKIFNLNIKEVFDHFRNILICGIVFFAAAYAFSRPTLSPLDEIASYITGGAMALLFVFLIAINVRYAFAVIRRQILNDKRWVNFCIRFFILLIYAVSVVELVGVASRVNAI